MDPIDNTELLVKVLEVQDLKDLMLRRLEENADTPGKKVTLEHIRSVVELQSNLIKNLMEHQLLVTEQLESLVQTIESMESP